MITLLKARYGRLGDTAWRLDYTITNATIEVSAVSQGHVIQLFSATPPLAAPYADRLLELTLEAIKADDGWFGMETFRRVMGKFNYEVK